MARASQLPWRSVLFVGAAAWAIWRLAQPSAASSLEQATIQEQAPKAGETPEQYDDRMRAWELATGQMMPRLMGYGYGQDAVDAFEVRPIGPQNDHWTYAR